MSQLDVGSSLGLEEQGVFKGSGLKMESALRAEDPHSPLSPSLLSKKRPRTSNDYNGADAGVAIKRYFQDHQDLALGDVLPPTDLEAHIAHFLH